MEKVFVSSASPSVPSLRELVRLSDEQGGVPVRVTPRDGRPKNIRSAEAFERMVNSLMDEYRETDEYRATI